MYNIVMYIIVKVCWLNHMTCMFTISALSSTIWPDQYSNGPDHDYFAGIFHTGLDGDTIISVTCLVLDLG